MQKSGSRVKTKKNQFLYKSVSAGKVSLVGEFNHWNPDSDPMNRDEDGTWTKSKMLPPGEVEYKFYVDGQWIQDPENSRTRSNGFGTLNSVVEIIA